MNTSSRLEQFLVNKGVSPTPLEKELGIGEGTIRKAIKGKTSLGSNVLELITGKFPDLSTHWLLTGEGEMLRSSRSDSGSVEENVAWYRNKIDQKDNKIEELDQMLKEQRAMIRELEQEIAELKDKLDECEEELLRANAAHIESGAAAHVG